MKRKHLLIGLAVLGLIFGLVGCTQPSAAVPDSPEDLCNEGWEHLMENEITDAQSSFNEALDINPGYCNAWTGLGWAALSTDDLEGSFINFSYGKQTVGDPLDQDTEEYQNLFFRFFMDAYVGSGLANYAAARYSMAIEDLETATNYDHSDNFDWNYYNWYTHEGDNYTVATWQAHLYCALAYLKDTTQDVADRLDGAEGHINQCRARNGESGDFNAGSLADANQEINRLLNLTDIPDPDPLDYPEGYPNH